jgi:hypothetical protein
LEFVGISQELQGGIADVVAFLEILNRAMPGSQYRQQAEIQAKHGDIFGEALLNSLADLFPENTGDVALAAIPVGRLKIARKLKINAASEAGQQLLDNLGLTVDEFVSKFRKAGIRARIPSEFLQKTVLEALQAGDSTVRKLLTDSRFAK